jgi:RNA-directed DNA polymerase
MARGVTTTVAARCARRPEAVQPWRGSSGGGEADPLRTFRRQAMHENLMEEVVAAESCRRALAAVKRNRGAPGIDRLEVGQLSDHLAAHGPQICAKLLEGRYAPSPVRRVEIPKADGGSRGLGLPTVLDRFIQQLLLQVLTPIFEPRFSVHSYGFRPGRSAHDAMRAAQAHAPEGRSWVVDFDISKFFDQVNHDLLMNRVASVIRDKRVLRLIGQYLRSGIMVEGVVIASEQGTPQGGPLSPLLANIYLDALDQELERRGHRFCRYAAACNIYVSSAAAAHRTMKSIQHWIERHLRLQLNSDKSAVGRVWERKFLGFRLNRALRIAAAAQSLNRFKLRVRQMWDSRQSRTSTQLRDRWRRYLRGWWGYYSLAQEREPIWRLEGWVRRHIRKCFWLRWHNRRGRERALRTLGLTGRYLLTAASSRGAWRIAATPTLQTALSKRALRRWGFLLPSDLAAQTG